MLGGQEFTKGLFQGPNTDKIMNLFMQSDDVLWMDKSVSVTNAAIYTPNWACWRVAVRLAKNWATLSEFTRGVLLRLIFLLLADFGEFLSFKL